MSDEQPPRVFPNRVRVLRKLRKKTQQDLADVLDMNKENISKIERWRVRLQPEHVEPLADYLEVHPGELFRPLPGHEDPNVAEAVEIIRATDAETVRLWLDNGLALARLLKPAPKPAPDKPKRKA